MWGAGSTLPRVAAAEAISSQTPAAVPQDEAGSDSPSSSSSTSTGTRQHITGQAPHPTGGTPALEQFSARAVGEKEARVAMDTSAARGAEERKSAKGSP